MIEEFGKYSLRVSRSADAILSKAIVGWVAKLKLNNYLALKPEIDEGLDPYCSTARYARFEEYESTNPVFHTISGVQSPVLTLGPIKSPRLEICSSPAMAWTRSPNSPK